ncbi:hypothetical protein OH77DRAFT_1431989 [Trametes cingulata]|nr:hypothetical protein OH77DRAFT_1431989 [Trametes cingulata]
MTRAARKRTLPQVKRAILQGQSRDTRRQGSERSAVTCQPNDEPQSPRQGESYSVTPPKVAPDTRCDHTRRLPEESRPTLPPLSSVLGYEYKGASSPIRRHARCPSSNPNLYPPIWRTDVRRNESLECATPLAPSDDPPGPARLQWSSERVRASAAASPPSAALRPVHQSPPSAPPGALPPFRSLSSVTICARPSSSAPVNAHALYSRTTSMDSAMQTCGNGQGLQGISRPHAPSTHAIWANTTVPLLHSHQGRTAPCITNDDGTRIPYIRLDEIRAPYQCRIPPPVIPGGLTLPDCISERALQKRLDDRREYQCTVRAQLVREHCRTSKYDCIEGGRLSGRLLANKLSPYWVPAPLYYGVYPARSAAARASPDPRDRFYTFAVVNPDMPMDKDSFPQEDSDDGYSSDEDASSPPPPAAHVPIQARAASGVGAPFSSM